jgi:hypothetical protein
MLLNYQTIGPWRQPASLFACARAELLRHHGSGAVRSCSARLRASRAPKVRLRVLGDPGAPQVIGVHLVSQVTQVPRLSLIANGCAALRVGNALSNSRHDRPSFV